jgi:transcriptional regulator with XRE-family HTH domain
MTAVAIPVGRTESGARRFDFASGTAGKTLGVCKSDDEPRGRRGRPPKSLILDGAEIRRLCAERGFTLRQLAERARRTEKLVRDAWNEKPVTPQVADAIASALNVTREQLLKRSAAADGQAVVGQTRAAAGEEVRRITKRELVTFGIGVAALNILFGALSAGLMHGSPPTQAAETTAPSAASHWRATDRQLIGLFEQLDSEVQSATANARPPLPESRFAKARAIIAQIEKIDPRNGTVFYYRATIERWLEDPRELGERSHDQFFRYLEYEAALPRAVAATGQSLEQCYERPFGYCSQRTAYVENTLAYDALRQARQAATPELRLDRYGKALTYAKAVLALRPEGFEQGVPTRLMVKEAEQAIQGSGPPAPARK